MDDDAVWVGSSMKASKAASFRGGLDAVAIHREIVSDADLKARFRRVGGGTVAQLAPVVMPELGPLPAGRVVATFHEGMPAQDRWLNAVEKLPGETLRWTGREFCCRGCRYVTTTGGFARVGKAPCSRDSPPM